jgi:hypothetical protein
MLRLTPDLRTRVVARQHTLHSQCANLVRKHFSTFGNNLLGLHSPGAVNTISAGYHFPAVVSPSAWNLLISLLLALSELPMRKTVVLKYHRREKVQSCVSQAGLFATQVARVKDNRVKYTAMDLINDLIR